MAFTAAQRKRKTRMLLERVSAEKVDAAIDALSADDLTDLDTYLEAADKLRFRQVRVQGSVGVNQASDRASLQRQVRALLDISADVIGVIGLGTD